MWHTFSVLFWLETQKPWLFNHLTAFNWNLSEFRPRSGQTVKYRNLKLGKQRHCFLFRLSAGIQWHSYPPPRYPSSPAMYRHLHPLAYLPFLSILGLTYLTHWQAVCGTLPSPEPAQLWLRAPVGRPPPRPSLTTHQCRMTLAPPSSPTQRSDRRRLTNTCVHRRVGLEDPVVGGLGWLESIRALEVSFLYPLYKLRIVATPRMDSCG